MDYSCPSSWNELSWKQLRDVWMLIDKYHQEPQLLTLHVWLYLTDLEFVKDDTRINERGDTMYLLRKRGKKGNEILGVSSTDLHIHLNGIHFTDEQRAALLETAREEAQKDTRSELEKELGLPFQPQDVNDHTFDDIVGTMEWVLNPNKLTALPKEYIRIGRRKYKLPSPEFMSLTWQQYSNCQKLLNAYIGLLTQEIKNKEEWKSKVKKTSVKTNDTDGSSKQDVSGDSTKQERVDAGKTIDDGTTVDLADTLVYRFISHLLLQGRMQFFSFSNGSFQLNIGTHYVYSVKDAERNINRMRKIDWYDVRILMQYFQSCQELMREKEYFPELFTGSSEKSNSAPIINEVNTINAIMKWEGTYPTQQDVYDANALNILGNLKDMANEAKEVDKMRRDTTRKK